MKEEKIIFIGSFKPTGNLDHGVTVKNQLLVSRLQDFLPVIKVVDTIKWRKNPFVLFKVLANFVFNPHAVFIVSLNTLSMYRLLKVLYSLRIKRKIYYSTIGGSLSKRMRQGIYKPKYYRTISHMMVEGEAMKLELQALGFKNVSWVRNFKPVKAVTKKKENNSVTKFVFLSRIMPEKGVELIFKAAASLNALGYESGYTVDFYGAIEPAYSVQFQSSLLSFTNASYKGFLNLSDYTGYSTLAQYDVMLFPTLFKNEGFPGVIIDAFIAGLPIIAAGWSLSREMIKEGVTGNVIPQNDPEALRETMLLYISKGVDTQILSQNCLMEARKYDVENVINEALLTEAGLL